MKKNLQIFIKIILILLTLTYSNSSLAIHEKLTFTWQDFVLKNGVLFHQNKDNIVLGVNGETIEFDSLPLGIGIRRKRRINHNVE